MTLTDTAPLPIRWQVPFEHLSCAHCSIGREERGVKLGSCMRLQLLKEMKRLQGLEEFRGEGRRDSYTSSKHLLSPVR